MEEVGRKKRTASNSGCLCEHSAKVRFCLLVEVKGTDRRGKETDLRSTCRLVFGFGSWDPSSSSKGATSSILSLTGLCFLWRALSSSCHNVIYKTICRSDFYENHSWPDNLTLLHAVKIWDVAPQSRLSKQGTGKVKGEQKGMDISRIWISCESYSTWAVVVSLHFSKESALFLQTAVQTLSWSCLTLAVWHFGSCCNNK